MDIKLYDKRVVKRNMVNGSIAKADYDKYIAGLPDLAGMAEPVHEKLYEETDTEETPTNDADA